MIVSGLFCVGRYTSEAKYAMRLRPWTESRQRTPEAGTACGETMVAHRVLLVCFFASLISNYIYSRPTHRLVSIGTRPELLFLSLFAYFLCRDLIACETLCLRVLAIKHARTHDWIHHTQRSHFFPMLRWMPFWIETKVALRALFQSS